MVTPQERGERIAREMEQLNMARGMVVNHLKHGSGLLPTPGEYVLLRRKYPNLLTSEEFLEQATPYLNRGERLSELVVDTVIKADPKLQDQ